MTTWSSDMRKTGGWLIASVGLLAAACTPVETEPELALTTTTAAVIRWGSSFGMCAGYCYEDLEINNATIRLTRTSRNPAQSPRVVERPFSREAWQALLQGMAAAGLDRLEDVYGCPDCADGGAEWVELESRDGRKRVTFEFGSGPEPLQQVISELRSLREQFPRE
jgi:hypothetical protein